jgi:hypothetical protein
MNTKSLPGFALWIQWAKKSRITAAISFAWVSSAKWPVS